MYALLRLSRQHRLHTAHSSNSRTPNGVYSSKWRLAARAKGGGHSQTRGRAVVTEMTGHRLRRQHLWAPVLVLSTIIFYCRSLCQWSLGMDTKCAPSSCGRRGLNRQKPLRVIFLPSLACRDRSQIIDLDRGSGHRSCTCTVYPKNFFFVVVSAVLHFTSSPFSFFFSCIVALHKHWRTLDHLTVSSACFGDALLAARFRSRRSCTCWLWTFSQRTFVWF